MDFQPNTTIYFGRTGIDDFNKVVCKSQEDILNIVARDGNLLGKTENNSFQRADGLFTVRVDHSDIPYYRLLNCDSLVYRNNETLQAFWIFCNILQVIWKNPDCSFVTFKIDYFMTYQPFIDWSSTYAYIEREHIKEDWSASGNPMFSNMGPAEDFNVVADTPFYSWTKTFKTDYVVVMSPYDASGDAVFDGANRGNLYTSLQIDLLSPSEANSRFEAISKKKTASINNIVGVYGCPGAWGDAIKNGGFVDGLGEAGDQTEDIPAINIAAKQLAGMPEYNNAKCWSAPFMNIRLMSSEGQEVDITPQWLGNDQSNYTVRYRIAGAGGMFAGAQCTFMNKNGAFDWKVWNDFIVSLSTLPACPWTGDGFTDWYSRNGIATRFAADNANFKSIGGLFRTIASPGKDIVSGGMNALTAGVETVADYIQNGLNLSATINNQKAAGATVNGAGTFNNLLDIAADSWGFKVVYYGTQIYTMLSIDAYFDRFGYRVNRLKKLELENRPIWTFIKTAECHVAATTGVPYIAERSINAMFNHGVTMWKNDKYTGGRKIGDFSNAKENRGIKG